MKYSVFIGRWQCIPPHKGHIVLIETALKEGKPVLIMIRDTAQDEKNPFSTEEREQALQEAFQKWGDMVKTMVIPDIGEVCYGRKVGYDIREIKLSPDLESISGTKIRKAQKGLWKNEIKKD